MLTREEVRKEILRWLEEGIRYQLSAPLPPYQNHGTWYHIGGFYHPHTTAAIFTQYATQEYSCHIDDSNRFSYNTPDFPNMGCYLSYDSMIEGLTDRYLHAYLTAPPNPPVSMTPHIQSTTEE